MKKFALFLLLNVLISTGLFSQAGSLDSTFSGDGKVTTKLIQNAYANAIAIQANGRIVVAGRTGNYPKHNFALVRYKPNGKIDNDFGVDGKVINDFGGNDGGYSVVIQEDGKILVAGAASNGSNDDFVLVRFKSNGEPDTSFGSNGKVTTDFGGSDYGCSVATQANGKIVVAGYSHDRSGDYDFALAQYKPNGKMDSSFGVNGKMTTDFAKRDDLGYSVAIQADGKIVVAGYSEADFALARYKPNGVLDKTFGVKGKTTTDFAGNGDIGRSVAIQADGKIVVAGYSQRGSSDFALARYLPNGTIDSVFGVNGKTTTNFGKSRDDLGLSVAIQSDGKIVAAGYSVIDANFNFAVARYQQNGQADTTFAETGKLITDFGGDDSGSSVAIQADGKIVVAGGSNNAFAVARYNGDNTSVSKAGANNFSNLQKQNNTSANIHFSPNPVKNILYIQGLSSLKKTISVLDAKGKVLQQTTSAENSYSFIVKQFSAGIYFIRIDEGDKTTILKFIKE